MSEPVETVISWTAPNMLTIFLMWFIAIVVIGFAVKLFIGSRGDNA